MGEVNTPVDQFQGRWRCALWWLPFALMAILAVGCGKGSEHTVQVVVAAPAGAETALEQTADGAAVAWDASSGIGGGTGGSELLAPGGDNPGPGGGPDGPSGPVGDTGGGEGSGGPGIAPGEGDRPGGLRLLAPTPPYEAVANEIYDMCDDQDAYVAEFGRALGPGEEITDDERHAIAVDRVINEVSCDEPGGRRYVYMSDVGPGGPFSTVEAAVEDHNDRNQNSDERRIKYPRDLPLGYFGHLGWNFPLEEIDEIRVVDGSVLVRDGAIRGLVRNFSKTMFAREVTVTARPAAGTQSQNNNARPVSGRFPLTVQPGERAPFEISGWTGSEDPDMIELSIAADLSDRVDITRSFAFGTGGSVTTRAVDERFFKNFVPDFVYQAEKHKIDKDGMLMIEYISAGPIAPTSHPSLKDQVLNQNIEDLRVYMALISADKVYDIVEPPLFRDLGEFHPHFYPQVISQPTYFKGGRFDGHFYGFDLVFIPEYSWHIWVGEPGPLDFNPRTLPETPPPTVDPDSLPQAPLQPIE